MSSKVLLGVTFLYSRKFKSKTQFLANSADMERRVLYPCFLCLTHARMFKNRKTLKLHLKYVHHQHGDTADNKCPYCGCDLPPGLHEVFAHISHRHGPK